MTRLLQAHLANPVIQIITHRPTDKTTVARKPGCLFILLLAGGIGSLNHWIDRDRSKLCIRWKFLDNTSVVTLIDSTDNPA